MNKKIFRAFISVSDKTGLIQVAQKLVDHKVEIIASKSVEQVTGFAPVLANPVIEIHLKSISLQ